MGSTLDHWFKGPRFRVHGLANDFEVLAGTGQPSLAPEKYIPQMRRV